MGVVRGIGQALAAPVVSYLEFVRGLLRIPSAEESRWRETACHPEALDRSAASSRPGWEAPGSALYAEHGTPLRRGLRSHCRPSPVPPGWSGLPASPLTSDRRLRAGDRRTA